MLTLNPDGMVIFAGVYQLFPIKTFWFLLLAGLGGMITYTLTHRYRTPKGYAIRGTIGIVMALVIMGALRDIAGKDFADWLSFLAGVFSYKFLMSLIKNMDAIINAVLRKAFNKLGMDFEDSKDDKSGI